GVAGCKAMCSGKAPELEHEASFVGRWMDLLRPGWERVEKAGGGLRELEHEAILVSLDNLMTFPFVRSGVEAGTLDLHGCWHDIGEGELMQYVPDRDAFVTV